MLFLSAPGCSDQSSRLSHGGEQAGSPPPLMPLHDETGQLSPPPAATRQAPLLPLAPLNGPAPLIAPRDWPADKPLAASQPATAPVRTAISGKGNLVAASAPGDWCFVFTEGGPEGIREMEVLPGSYLEQMASIVKGSPDHPILFQITAELTRYKKQPYLIVRSAEYIRPATGEAEDTP